MNYINNAYFNENLYWFNLMSKKIRGIPGQTRSQQILKPVLPYDHSKPAAKRSIVQRHTSTGAESHE